MSWGYRNSGIPTISSYADALARWESITPIRGRKEDLRPIGNRKNTWYSISKDEHDTIHCNMNEVTLVSFFKDDIVRITNFPYITTSTSNFINDVVRYMGVTTYIKDHSLVVKIKGQQQRVNKAESIDLVGNGHRNYHFVETKPPVTHILQRIQTNIVRKSYEDFRVYVRALAKLRSYDVISGTEMDNAIDHSINILNVRYVTQNSSNFIMCVMALTQFKSWMQDKSENKYEGYYKMVMVLLQNRGYNWRKGGKVINAEHIIEDFNKVVLGLHRDECISEKQTKSGLVQTDSYGQYFTPVWDEFCKGATKEY